MANAVRAWLAIVACACAPAGGTATSAGAPATPEEVAAFCDRVDELGDVSRTELMLGLIEVAPTEVRPAIRRASELGGSTFEDDVLIDEWLERCRT